MLFAGVRQRMVGIALACLVGLAFVYRKYRGISEERSNIRKASRRLVENL